MSEIEEYQKDWNNKIEQILCPEEFEDMEEELLTIDDLSPDYEWKAFSEIDLDKEKDTSIVFYKPENELLDNVLFMNENDEPIGLFCIKGQKDRTRNRSFRPDWTSNEDRTRNRSLRPNWTSNQSKSEYILGADAEKFCFDKMESGNFYFIFCDINSKIYKVSSQVNYHNVDECIDIIQTLLKAEKNEFKNILSESKEKNKIKVPSKIDFFKGLDITEKDNLFVDIDIDSNILPKVLLVNGEDNIVGLFNLVNRNIDKLGKKQMLTANASNLHFENHNSTKYFFVFGDENENLYKVPIEVNCQNLETTSTHLCIDFGTSNTTAGCFLDREYVNNVSNLAVSNGNIKLGSENITTFEDLESGNLSYKNIVPTVAYIEDCSNSQNIKYLFGYKAKERIKEDKYCPKASCFMEMKCWISNIDVIEEIQDTKGNKAKVNRKEIIAKYLEFIIKTSENQYKCHFKNIHISAPVKLKEKALNIYADILTELEQKKEEQNQEEKEQKYILEREHAIDEGVAVLYNIIDSQMKDKSYKDGEEKRALIIDCGGGTSDLASCRYTIHKDEDNIINLDITTEYMNGDINFGGNNLTYRIMKYMKVVYAEQFQKEEQEKNSDKIKKESKPRIDIDEIITQDENFLFSYIEGEVENDDYTKVNERYKEVYKKLEQAYKEAEEIIPTSYKYYENEPKDIYDKVKNNFYFLWEIAEEMKKAFYLNTSTVRYKFDKKAEDNTEVGLSVKSISDWKLSAFKDGDLVEQKQPDRIFTVKEINKLLKADIYYLVRKFLNDLYLNDTLDSYSHIKLSGQSSKINIFMDSLKEFLPGKKIKSEKIHSKGNDAEELKLLCLKGAITYLNALEESNIEVNLKNETKIIPISVYIKNENNEYEEMVHQGFEWKQPVRKRRITSAGKEIYLHMKDIDKGIDEIYKYKCENIEWNKIENKGLQELIDNSNIKQEDIDNLSENKKYIFVVLDEKEWGFYILPIYRNKENEINTGKREFCSFEMDILKKTFFDGRK